MSEKIAVIGKPVNKPFRKGVYILKIIGWLIMLFIISEFLISLNPETVITNWGIGLIGMIVFGIFYCIDNVRFVLFRANKFNAFMITFFLAWFISDWDEFIQIIVEIIGGIFGGG